MSHHAVVAQLPVVALVLSSLHLELLRRQHLAHRGDRLVHGVGRELPALGMLADNLLVGRVVDALVGAHDEDAAGCVVGNLVRHTAQEEPRRAAHAPITDDQEVGVLLLGDGDQRLGGVIAPRMRDGLQPLSCRGSRRCL